MSMMRASPEPCTPSEPSPDDPHGEADCSILRRSVRVHNDSGTLGFWSQSFHVSFDLATFLVLLPMATLRYVEAERHHSERDPVPYVQQVMAIQRQQGIESNPVLRMFIRSLAHELTETVLWACFLIILILYWLFTP